MQIPNFIQDLNPSQQAAVLFNDGASLVIAGAGSGKTRVLTYKIAYLLHLGLPAQSILALTFTNKAAREMKDRISQMVGWQTSRHLWMGTFHSIFSRILRAEAETLGFTSHFTIYDTSESKSLIKSILKEMALDEKLYEPKKLLGRISWAKNNLFSPAAWRGNQDMLKDDYYLKMPQFVDIYTTYTNRCRAANAMDFDDLLYYTNVLFRDYADILAKYKSFFQYILVDEYQDTNFAQYLIVKRLAEDHHRLCVVGDDAQSIYSFRGANIDNILGFKNDYADCRIFKLEQNYRSTQNIVNAANSLIAKNKGQIPKTVFSTNDKGEHIIVNSVYSDYDEGFTVANSIMDMHKTSSPYNEFAILYRTNSQSRVLEDALRKSAIPYRIYGGLSFYQRKEIKDVLAYFRLAINPQDEESLKRVINEPKRGIGDTTIDKIIAAARTHEVSAWETLSDTLRYNVGVNAGTTAKLQKFRDIIEPFHEKVTETNAYEIGTELVKRSGIVAELMATPSPENDSRRDNIEELLKAIHEFCEMRLEDDGTVATLADFLSEVSLLTDQDDKEDKESQKVTLMTVHASKGLEFKHVFIVGMEENLFPSPRTLDDPRGLEEERRLFYVAITRAKETCHISYAKSRFRHGKTDFCNPSRFLKDIDEQFLRHSVSANIFSNNSFEKQNSPFGQNRFPQNNFTENAPKRVFTQSSPQKPLQKLPTTNQTVTHKTIGGLTEGQWVEHNLFGRGQIKSLSGTAGDLRAVVSFETIGEKNLLLKYAKLTPINDN